MVSRDYILNHTNNGRDVLQHYLKVEPKKGRNIQNPFTKKQQTPSFNLYQNGAGEWRYNDFATDDKGSWLDLVMRLHGLTMQEALADIKQRLGLAEEPSPKLHRSSNQDVQISATVKLARPFDPIYRHSFTAEELAFWQQSGIDSDILEKYGVKSLQEFTATRADGEDYAISFRASNPHFAYDAGAGFIKVYAPYASNKAYKFTWPTGQPSNYKFGFDQLKDWQPLILLAAGEKDAMTLSANGYPAITVGSESAYVSAELIAELKERCDEILVCYDADETGRKRANEIAGEHDLRWIEWPAELAPYGKDATDFYQAVRLGQLGIELFEEAIQQASPSLLKRSLPVISEDQETTVALPGFESELYNSLPDFLRRACAPFDGHEKAVMLLSSLGILSGCFPGVGGIYDQRRYGLNLYAFVIAPAASGKGTMMHARRLARPYHKRLTNESNHMRAAYEAELHAYKPGGKGKAVSLPTPPPHRMLFLPGDTTAAALLGALADNEGRGIICENEADTLTSAMGGEHGKFADKLCKVFQHEPVPLMRKGDKLYLELERPAVSIVLTGTPGQLPRLMPTAENGLISRFLFYCYSQPYTWRSGAPNGRLPLEPYFDELGEELTRMIDATPGVDENGAGGVDITLSMADWERLNAAGEAGLKDAVKIAGDAGASSAFRLGQIAFRLIGLLTVLRRFENGEAPVGSIEADPQDVTVALTIMHIARAHALHVLKSLPCSKQNRAGNQHAIKADVIARACELRSQGFSVRDIAEKTGYPKSTINNWLANRAA